jgi:threonine aldolase
VGSRELIEEAWRYKQMWGGAMRQSGVVAAAGLYALDHHVERLADDHENARALAEGLAAIDGVTIDPSTVETNIVVFEVADAVQTGEALRSAGVQVTRLDATRIRAVTHLDVDRAGIERALEVMRDVIPRTA